MRSVDPKYNLVELPGGLRVAAVEMPHMASVALGVWAGVGGRFESAEFNGISHFIEHMLFKGTRRRNSRQISESIEGAGGYLNAFTSEEHTCFYARAHHERLEEMLDVLSDMYLNSVFDPAEIGKERDVIKEEVAMYLDQPAQHVQELLNATAWPGQPLGRPLTGTPETLDRMKRPHFLDYMSVHYSTGSTVIAAAGNIRCKDLVKLAERRFKRLRKGVQKGFSPAASAQTAPVIAARARPAEQTQIAFGVRACSRHDSRRYALRALNAILGENMSSRLFQSLREERGLAYNIGTSLSFWADAGDIVVSAGVDAAKVEPAMKAVILELKRLTRETVGKAEFGRARDYILGQFDLGLESTENHMMHLGEQVLGYGALMAPSESRKRLAAVTPAQVRSLAEELFRPERFTLALVGPKQNTDRLKKILGKWR